MNENYDPHLQLGAFRFGIIGQLLQSPLEKGTLLPALKDLSAKEWVHPIKGQKVRFHWTTLERWYYLARNNKGPPYTKLSRKTRQGAGQQRMIHPALEQAVIELYSKHSSWSVTLLVDELRALARKNSQLEPVPSYSTVKRYLQARGMDRRKRVREDRPGHYEAHKRIEGREIRSFEYQHVGALWHLDFHKGKIRVVDRDGQIKAPMALAIIDDSSRFICHMQWYFSETTECLVHGFIQAIQKLGIPGNLMTDNGSAMTSAEFTQGLTRLGITHETILEYSPYQNAKQERFWGTLEGRLIPLLDGIKDIDIAKINEVTQIWLDQDYHRKEHDELSGSSPRDKYLQGPDIHKPCTLESQELKSSFTMATRRRQRKTDGTVSLEGRRFEIPDRFRFLKEIPIRYARWDLSRVHIYDKSSDKIVCKIGPLDKAKNASGLRKNRSNPLPIANPSETIAEPPALLVEMIENFKKTGLPPAYIPFIEETDHAE
ncbi:MAG: DDE-type integrase/transposase/recombinase [Proteobacteria bacterium]|nr:DDE-type integrase/transposase/recombinase [Pseudomonadota bacterium]